MKWGSHHSKLEEKVQTGILLDSRQTHWTRISLHEKTHKQTSSVSRWCYQKFEQPEAGLVIASLEGIDEEEEKQAI